MRPKRHKPGEEMEPVEVYARVKAIPEYDDRKRVILSFIIFYWYFTKITPLIIILENFLSKIEIADDV